MTEREVDAVLRAFYEADWVSLRRMLIDADLMARSDGWYWRIGGWVDVDASIVDESGAAGIGRGD